MYSTSESWSQGIRLKWYCMWKGSGLMTLWHRCMGKIDIYFCWVCNFRYLHIVVLTNMIRTSKKSRRSYQDGFVIKILMSMGDMEWFWLGAREIRTNGANLASREYWVDVWAELKWMEGSLLEELFWGWGWSHPPSLTRGNNVRLILRVVLLESMDEGRRTKEGFYQDDIGVRWS